MKYLVLDEVESTNQIVKEELLAGRPEGFMVRARCQHAGYGRQGREWDSPLGGLYFSMLLRPQVSGYGLATLSLVAATAIQRALSTLVLPEYTDAVQIKWPNDIVMASLHPAVKLQFAPSLGDPSDLLSEISHPASADAEYQKVCGISLETHGGGVCLGVGINIFHPEIERPITGRNVPVYLADYMPALDENESGTLSESVAALTPARQNRTRERIVDAVQREVVARIRVSYNRWCDIGFEPARLMFNTCDFLYGKQVHIEDLHHTVTAEGVAAGIDERGRLLIDTNDGVRAISSGEAHVKLES